MKILVYVSLMMAFALTGCENGQFCDGDIAEPQLFDADEIIVELDLRESVFNPESCANLTFAKLDGDSRCPADVECVWEGEVTVTLAVKYGAQSKVFQLKNTDAGYVVSHGLNSFSIKLLDVTYRDNEDHTPVATLKIERLSDSN